MYITNVSYFNSQGCDTADCQDTVYLLDKGNTAVYSLADGVSSKQLSTFGAKAVQENLAAFAVNCSQFIFSTPESWVKKAFIEQIRTTMSQLSKFHHIPEEEFASTLLFIVLSKKYGKCKWIHIGDGAILKKENGQDSPKIISHPHNGITPEYTFTTASKQLERYLHIGNENLDSIENLFLATDGAFLPFYAQRNLTDFGKDTFSAGIQNLYDTLSASHPRDDFSILEISVTLH